MAKAKRVAARSKPRRERCQLCKAVLDHISPGHLREHGYTVERYERVFGVRSPASTATRLPAGSVSDPNTGMVGAVAERLLDDRVWVACIADEVGERMMNGPLRQRLSALLTTMLAQRAQVHGQSLAVLSGALTELQAEWRTTQGGANGAPTDTDVLLRMVDRASKLVVDSEQAVQRTMKLALEEQKMAADYADALGPALYQGTGETLDMPVGVTTGDRETIRNLLSIIGKTANEQGTVDAAFEPVEVEQGTGSDGEGVTTLHSDDESVTTLQSDDEHAPARGSVSDPTAAPRRRRRRRGAPPPLVPPADDASTRTVNDSSRDDYGAGTPPGDA